MALATKEENRGDVVRPPPTEPQSTPVSPAGVYDLDPDEVMLDSEIQHETKPPSADSRPNQNGGSPSQPSVLICSRNGCPYNNDLSAMPECVGFFICTLEIRLPHNEDAKEQISYLKDPDSYEHSPICPKINELSSWVYDQVMSFVAAPKPSRPAQEPLDVRKRLKIDDGDCDMAGC
ncbi:MAG: hypothetical protein HETSPECPRED_008649 [Heterodermia speciosa]|uniref:Uncharacterized protein n=1 Tax=Heterodermia speciosa TaxID=116794 RepID=A0A8H3FYQ8_9LECA|nr:MAG: hypothetical protein HETSPECPRED_008649 [Heterodermia speciosa]